MRIQVELIEKPNGFLRIKDLNPENRKTSDLTKTGKKYLADKLADIRLRTSNSNNFSSFMERKDSSGSRIEMGGPRCKMFNHDAMSGARGQRSCLVHILICKRCKIGATGAMAPGSTTERSHLLALCLEEM